MEYIRLNMINKKLVLPPPLSLPQGYSMRLYQDGDEYHWARITYEAEEFDTINEALKYFNEQFTSEKDKLYSGCFFCCDENGLPIGSSLAWSGKQDRIDQGMLRWVVVSKKHQGNKLCKPLVSAAMHNLFEKYESAFLHTQTTSYKGIKVYLDMGFEAVDEGELSRRGWHLVWNVLRHQKLVNYSKFNNTYQR